MTHWPHSNKTKVISILILLYYSDVVDEDSERKKLVKDTFAADKAKSEKILQLRNKKNRDIALLERKIDEVPSRGELMQYQRQFVDLYEQVILPSLLSLRFLPSLLFLLYSLAHHFARSLLVSRRPGSTSAHTTHWRAHVQFWPVKCPSSTPSKITTNRL